MAARISPNFNMPRPCTGPLIPLEIWTGDALPPVLQQSLQLNCIIVLEFHYNSGIYAPGIPIEIRCIMWTRWVHAAAELKVFWIEVKLLRYELQMY